MKKFLLVVVFLVFGFVNQASAVVIVTSSCNPCEYSSTELSEVYLTVSGLKPKSTVRFGYEAFCPQGCYSAIFASDRKVPASGVVEDWRIVLQYPGHYHITIYEGKNLLHMTPIATYELDYIDSDGL